MTPEQELVIERARAYVETFGRPDSARSDYADLYEAVKALDTAERPSLTDVLERQLEIVIAEMERQDGWLDLNTAARRLAAAVRHAGLVKDEPDSSPENYSCEKGWKS